MQSKQSCLLTPARVLKRTRALRNETDVIPTSQINKSYEYAVDGFFCFTGLKTFTRPNLSLGWCLSYRNVKNLFNL